MKSFAILLVNWLWLVAAQAAATGDPAEPLQVAESIKGGPVTSTDGKDKAVHVAAGTFDAQAAKDEATKEKHEENVTLQDEYFEAASMRDSKDESAEIGEKILKEEADSPAKLNGFAWAILTDDALLHHDYPLALRAAKRAFELTEGKDCAIIDTYARALFLTGKANDAIALQRKAVDLCANPKQRLVLKETLADYEHPAADNNPEDAQRVERFINEVQTLIKAGKTVPMDQLLARTDVKPCKVELAKPSTQPVTSEDLYERARQSVLVVGTLNKNDESLDWDVAMATGFIIHESGVFVTNFHVLDNPGSAVMAAMTADGRVYPVKSVLAVAPFADIAICQLDGASGMKPLPLLANAKPGSHIRILSHPDNAFYSLSEGVISRYAVYRADGKSTTVLTTTAEFASGSSGGPLFDNCGNVTGMVASTSTVYSGPEEFATNPTAGDESGDEDKGDVQMVLKMCVPSADILKLVGGPG